MARSLNCHKNGGSWVIFSCDTASEDERPKSPQGDCGKIGGGHMARMGWGVHHRAHHLEAKPLETQTRGAEENEIDPLHFTRYSSHSGYSGVI